MDDAPTKVVFRQWRRAPHSIIALFPEIPADLNGYECQSYEHVGQHGGADYEGVIRDTRPALRGGTFTVAALEALADVCALVYELEGRGYVLEPVARCTPAMRRARFDEARSLRIVGTDA
jgi:hypothetical protein